MNLDNAPTPPVLEAWLCDWIRRECNLPVDSSMRGEPFSALGLKSRDAVALAGALGEALGREVAPVVLYDYPSIRALAEHLALGGAAPVMETPQHAAGAMAMEPVAIIGMGCRFPQGHGPAAFWRLLAEGREGIVDTPPDRWDVDAYHDPDPAAPGKIVTRRGGFIERVDAFDAAFFGISPREAVSMDPQQRLLLETSWETFEHAGIAPGSLAGSATGVFIGISSSDYSQYFFGREGRVDAYTGTGAAMSIAANRLSYWYDFRGPSMSVDTACSSSLSALHAACLSLRAGDCSVALAGGVNLILTPDLSIAFSKAGMLAPDGCCKTFDARADGYVRGEGCGLVLLKPLSRAIADGDRVLAVIRGSAVNQDGRSNGLTAPNGLAQQSVMRRALANAGLAAEDVDYIEAHGTGTRLGDPIEMESIKAVYGERVSGPVQVGSVKTNIGHLEAAAGVAGLLKTALALEHGEIPAHLHFQSLNPLIDLSGGNIAIAVSPQPWPRNAKPRCAGISAFGFGGTNVHVIIEEPPVKARRGSGIERPRHVFTLSARTAGALKKAADAQADHVAAHPRMPLADRCYTAAMGRTHFEHRLSISVSGNAELGAGLRAYASGKTARGVQHGVCTQGPRPRIAFLFTGQGAQYAGMGRALYASQPAFQEVLDRCDVVLRPYLGQSLLSILYPENGGDSPLLDQTAYTQPALFALECALAAVWRAWGIAPDYVLGHSVGEYAAACVAGAFSLEDGLRLIAERAGRMQRLAAGGGMMAVMAPADQVEKALIPFEGKLEIAGLNGPALTVISGPCELLREAEKAFAAKGVECKPLTVSHAFHSALMEPMLPGFHDVAEEIAFAPLETPLVSNMTGAIVARGEVLDAEYWTVHVRKPVRFAEGMSLLAQQGVDVFAEIGPAPVLLGMGKRCVPEAKGAWIASLRRDQDDWETLLDALGAMYVQGVAVDWQGFEKGYARQRIAMPVYPFEHKRYWVEGTASLRAEMGTAGGETIDAESDAGIFYGIAWEEKSRANSEIEAIDGRWILFSDQAGVGAKLAESITARGGQCVRVYPGSAYVDGGDGTFRIRLDAPADYARLAARLLQDAALPPCRGVVHLWSLDIPAVHCACGMLDAQMLGCLAVLHWFQAVVKSVPNAFPPVYAVTRGAQAVMPDAGAPGLAQSAVWGLGRVLPLEHPGARIVLIDLPEVDDAVDVLLGDVLGPCEETQIAYRDARRFAARLVEKPGAMEKVSLPLNADGVYVIAGGLGGLGLFMARMLAAHGARRIVLTSRNGLPDRAVWDSLDASSPEAARVSAVRALEALGAEVRVAAVDVADAEGMLALAGMLARDGWGPVRGVIHAAGALTVSLAADLDAEAAWKTLRPRVIGGWLLHDAFKDAPLDFFVLFSSASAVLGSPGMADYAAANAFLDALAWDLRARGIRAFSINWGPWAEIGMAADSELGRRLAVRGLAPLTPETAWDAFTRIVAGESVQTMVMHADWPVMSRAFPGMQDMPFFATVMRAHEEAGDAALSLEKRATLVRELAPDQRVEALRGYLRALAAGILRVGEDELELGRGAVDLGLDSILVMEMTRTLEKQIGLKLHPREVFERASLDELAAYIHKELNRTDAPVASDLQAAQTAFAAWTRRESRAAPARRLPGPVFLLSSPRSGSTLLRVMLAGHPDLFCPPELHLLPFDTMRERQEKLGLTYLGEGLDRAWMEAAGCDAETAQATVHDWIERNASTAEVYAALAAQVNPRRVVDKSPSYAIDRATLDWAEALFDGALYIHLARHPYAVIESFMRNRFEKLLGASDADPAIMAEQVWTLCNGNTLALGEQVGPGRVHRVLYEDLVREPARVMEGLCAFLGVPFTDSVLKPYEGKRMTDGLRPESLGIGDPNFLQRKQIESGLADAWRNFRPPRALSEETRRVASLLGYALPHDDAQDLMELEEGAI